MVYLFSLFIALSPEASAKKSIGYLVTRFMAKEYCSCRYVVKQSSKVCQDENKTSKVLVRIQEDPKNKVITASNIFTKTQARFVGEKQGCLLDKQP